MAKFGGSAKNSDILQRVSPYARRLVAESIHTASSKMAPLTIYCQKVATSIMLMPLSRADIINAPITAPATLPMPPARLVPPMTQAAMASSSAILPAEGTPRRAVS